MVVADLHVHTTNSDGQLTLPEVPAAAREAGVEVVALTDHDRLHPALPGPVETRDGVTLIHGIELRVQAGENRVDLLGYAAHRTDALTRLVAQLQDNRIERARTMLDCLEAETGVRPAVPLEPGVGRPHIARAIAEGPAPYTYEEAFEQLIGYDCPCYVARDIPSFDEGVAVLREACGVVSLAHPLRYPDPAAALALLSRLDAVERQYPYDRRVDETVVERARIDHEVLATGGSDAHDTTLGRAGLGPEAYAQFRDAL
ncbi:MAG: PHP domain-containing protein [Halovenus sp.]